MWSQWNNVVVGARHRAERTELPTTESMTRGAGSPARRWRGALGRYLRDVRFVPRTREQSAAPSDTAESAEFWLPHEVATTIAHILIAIDFALPSGRHDGRRAARRRAD